MDILKIKTRILVVDSNNYEFPPRASISYYSAFLGVMSKTPNLSDNLQVGHVLKAWLDENLSGAYMFDPHIVEGSTSIYFQLEQDAILFKLTFD